MNVRPAYPRVVLAEADNGVARTSLEEIDKVLRLNQVRYEQGERSGVEVRGLADAVVGALMTSTLLALLVRPTLYGWFDGTRNGD